MKPPLSPTPRARGVTPRLDVRISGSAQRGAAIVCVALPLCAARLGAQRCQRTESRTNLAAFAGERVRSLDIATEHPVERGVAAAVVGKLHVRTRAGAIRQRLLVARGDLVDTARVAESLRRLRRLRFLDDAYFVAERCDGEDGVALTVATRDAWSISPEMRLAPAPPPGVEEVQPAGGMRLPNGLVGAEERNFLGSGRELRAGLETRGGRLGGSVSVVDPFVLGLPAVGRVRLSRLPNEHLASVTLRSDEHDLAGPWRGTLLVTDQSRWPMFGAAGQIDRTSWQALAGRRVTRDDARSALYLSAGAEYGDARLTRFDGMLTPGPATAARRFVGADFGVDGVARRYSPSTWLLPHGAVFDVPQGFEYSAVVGLGEERLTGAAAAHLDAWTGRLWQPNGHTVLATDAWSSGYVYDRHVAAGVLRGVTTAVAHAAGGTWMARVGVERLLNSDPDVRPLVGLDPTARMVDPQARLAGTVVAATLERALRVELPVGRSAVDVVAFGAGSMRRSPCDSMAATTLRAAVVGLGLRTVPVAAARGVLRLDWAVPVSGSPGVRRRPYATLSFVPGFTADRVRDALRGR